MQIHSVPEGQSVWVVRCEHGDFFQHFRSFGLVAIGHMDEDAKGKVAPQFLLKSLDQRLSDAYERLIKSDDATRSSINARLGQVRRFIEDIAIGDLVVTMATYSRLVIGRVIGNAYFDDSPMNLKASSPHHRPLTLKFGLRRRVAWGPVVERAELPQATRRALNGNMTLFNVDSHARAIHHLLYAAFEDDVGLHTTINLTQPKDLDNFSVSTLFRFLSQAEALAEAAAQLDGADFTENALLAKYQQILLSGELGLTSKAQFMSEGDVWSTLAKSAQPIIKALFYKQPRKYLYFVTAVLVIGGNTKLGFPGLVDKAMITDGVKGTVDLVEKVASKLWVESNGPDVAGKLKPRFPTYDTSALRNASQDEEPVVGKKGK